MRKLLGLTFVLTTLALSGCTEWQWAKSEAVVDNVWPIGASCLDHSGNLILTGNFEPGSIYEDPAPLVNSGREDVLIAKHSPNGDKIWVKRFGGNGPEQNTSVATDYSSNIIISGNYGSSTLDFGNGQILSNHGGRDCYIVKFNMNGNLVWAKGLGNAVNDGQAGVYSSCDNSGNVYVTGNYVGSVLDFGNGVVINSGGPANNNFVAKFSPSGTPLWAKGILCNSDQDQVTSLCVDNTGSVFVTGRFVSSSILFQGLSGPLTRISAGDNIFFVKYAADGTPLWNQCLGAGVSKAITCDGVNNVYMTGVFYGNNNEFGGHSLQVASGDASGRFGGDFFVSKFQSGGSAKTSWAWAKSAGGPFIDMGTAISADNSVVWVGGIFGSTTIGDFGKPSTSIDNATKVIPSASAAFQHFDSFVAEFDPDGQLANVYPFGNDGNDEINSISINGPLGYGVFVSGFYTSNSLSFGSLSPVSKTPAGSSNNLFIANRTWKAHGS